jgi:hypothetical protein
MSGRNRLQLVLLSSAFVLAACSEDGRTPAAPVVSNEARTASSQSAQPSPILELLPGQRTGSPNLVNTTEYDPARPGSLLSVHQRSMQSGLTSEVRVVHERSGDQLEWRINGRRFASLDYGSLPQNTTSLEAVTRTAGRLSFYGSAGELTAVFDPATRKLTRIRTPDDRAVNINPFGDDAECEDALFGFYSNVVALALVMHSGNAISTWGGMTGLYFTWGKVETDCYWVFRITMWEFANSTLGTWWYR